MAHEAPKEFGAAVVFGRFNLLHRGHTALFDTMAQKAGVVIVGLSNNERNIEPRLRVRVIKDAMNDMGINFRVLTADQPFAFFDQVHREYSNLNIMSMFGEDQYKLGKAAERVYGWEPHVIPRLTSSTTIRGLIDNEEWDVLARLVPGCIINDVIKLRKLETN